MNPPAEHRSGLSAEAAKHRLAQSGPNELPAGRAPTLLAQVARALAEPMLGLLAAAAVIYLFLGDPVEAIFLLMSLVGILFITVYQQHKTERALAAMRELSSPRASVIRDGVEQRIAGREVVPGDLLLVREGDRVAADGEVLDVAALEVDESLVTGESMPVAKRPEAADSDSGRVYAGTLAVRGHGVVRVTATGTQSTIGQIGGSLAALGIEDTALQSEIRLLARGLAAAALVVCTLVVVVYGFTRGDWLNGVLAGLALAMSLMPEELPVVIAVFLAIGAWRMARNHVLTRRIPAIEALGAATVLCVDKTGTLTQNRMSVRRIYAAGRIADVGPESPSAPPGPIAEVLVLGMLASEPNPFDPMEIAFHAAPEPHPPSSRELIRRYPLSPRLLAVTHVWQNAGGHRLTIAAKGAPETIVRLCALGGNEAQVILAAAGAMAQDGLRVLGVAGGELDDTPLPDDPHDFRLRFAGLVGLADPLRASVPGAIKECLDAGVRVVMITGDFPPTARTIGREAGISSDPVVVTGKELDAMSDEALARQLPAITIFARVTPPQKLRIVQALQGLGEVVAMTGDGVNDAPALKAADIGIAMGGRGTDVAREAAALVLLDDEFTSIVLAIRHGRRIFDNLRKALSYVISVHVPIAGMGLVPVLLGGPLIFFPAHIVFLEFVIDPTCSVAFEAEPEDPGLMNRPPRGRHQRLLRGAPLIHALTQGAIALGYVLLVYWLANAHFADEAHTRLLTFTAVVLANLSLIFFTHAGGMRRWMRTPAANHWLWAVVAATLVAYFALLATPWLRTAFRLAAFTWEDAGYMAIATAALWVALITLNMAETLRRGQSNAATP